MSYAPSFKCNHLTLQIYVHCVNHGGDEDDT